MASHSYIFNLEESIEAAQQTVCNAKAAYQYECGSECTGRGHAANHDVWGTLVINARVLQAHLAEFLKLTEKEFPG